MSSQAQQQFQLFLLAQYRVFLFRNLILLRYLWKISSSLKIAGENLESSCRSQKGTKYNSQELDKESDLYFFNARHYDPEIARFVTADTVVDGQASIKGWNRFMYVAGNPIVFSDPTGNAIATSRKGFDNHPFNKALQKVADDLRLDHPDSSVANFIANVIEPDPEAISLPGTKGVGLFGTVFKKSISKATSKGLTKAFGKNLLSTGKRSVKLLKASNSFFKKKVPLAKSVSGKLSKIQKATGLSSKQIFDSAKKSKFAFIDIRKQEGRVRNTVNILIKSPKAPAGTRIRVTLTSDLKKVISTGFVKTRRAAALVKEGSFIPAKLVE